MTGKQSGFVERVNYYSNLLHDSPRGLAAKEIDKSLAYEFSTCVKIFNFIKARPLNHRLFETLCHKMEAKHNHLLLHTEVRWLPRGHIQERLYELREELLVFLNEHNPSLALFLADETWIARLAYLADILNILNSLNRAMQDQTQIF